MKFNFGDKKLIFFVIFISFFYSNTSFATTAKKKPQKKISKETASQSVVMPARTTYNIHNLPPATAPIPSDKSWKPLFTAGLGKISFGTYETLKSYVSANHTQTAVSFNSFHGDISGICKTAYVTEDDEVYCSIEIWCDVKEATEIPSRHAHKAIMSSSGQINYTITTLNERGEEKVLAFGGDAELVISWYGK